MSETMLECSTFLRELIVGSWERLAGAVRITRASHRITSQSQRVA